MRRLVMIAGGGLVVIGLWDLMRGATWSSLRATAVWFFGGTLLHDAGAVPLTVVVGLALSRFVPPRYRGIVQGALVISATVALALLPLLSGRGRVADNPSQQPLDYGRGLLLALAVVWAVAAGLAIVRRRRSTADVPGG